MQEISLQTETSLSDAQLIKAIENYAQTLFECGRVLLVPPDITRYHSRAGEIACLLYMELIKHGVHVDVLPALGTHTAMTDQERLRMLPIIPQKNLLVHDYRNGVKKIAEVSADYVKNVSEGLMDEPIAVEVSSYLFNYDQIVCIGQVVPHEVAGLSSHLKHLFVGCGGHNMIDSTHFLGAVYGMERVMGKVNTPVRLVFDEAYRLCKDDLPPIDWLLTVLGPDEKGNSVLRALHGGNTRACFERAAACSARDNIIYVPHPLQNCVVYLDPSEYRSTWLGGKAIYRTRLAMADGGHLVIIAPGVKMFGEDATCNALIEKYGYRGRDEILMQEKKNQDLHENRSAAAHLVHGSSEGRFSITYATNALSQEQVEGVGYNYMPLEAALARYEPEKRQDGNQTLADGQEIFFISNPALGLWSIAREIASQG